MVTPPGHYKKNDDNNAPQTLEKIADSDAPRTSAILFKKHFEGGAAEISAPPSKIMSTKPQL